MTKMIFSVFFLLLAISRAEYVEITKKNVNEYIGGSKTSFIKFYSPSCGHCRAMKADFDEAATTFTDVTFGGVDCTAQKDICDAHKVSGYPTLLLFKAGEKTGIEFNGQRTVDSFDDFIENYTTFKAKRIPPVFLELNPVNFDHQISNRTCTFVTFFAPWCGHCKAFLPQAKIAAAAFINEPNASIGRINCEEYKDFCSQKEVSGYPTIKLFKNTGEVIQYSGGRTAEAVAAFLNENCGTERAIDGLLTDQAGLIAEARQIVNEFLQGSKEEAKKKMAEIKGSDIYLKVMDRIMTKGVEQIKKDVEIMKGILDSRKSSIKALDGIKRRFNVFNEFLYVPTPSPEPTLPPTPVVTPNPEAASEKQAEL